MNARLPAAALNAARALAQVSRAWDEDIVGQISEYIRIPAKSPMFDADWAQNGFIETVVRNAAALVEAPQVGPNEFLHVPYAKKLTAAVAQVIVQVPCRGRAVETVATVHCLMAR